MGRRAGPATCSAKAAAAAWLLACVLTTCVAQQRYRFCAVKDGTKNRIITKYCPMLKGDGSRAECVYGNSRLDCLRLIAKSEADFGIFQPEDLLVARKDRAGDFVITHNIKNFQTEYDYKLVVIVRKSANIFSARDLRDQNLCHPGHGYETDWTEVEGKFFEERVVPQTCDSELTVSENFIKSSSSFFKAACKAGPWVSDSKLDALLKKKYSNLCSLCDRPKLCSKADKYWGRTGPLYCLTDGFGDVAWARLDDAKFHFGLSPESHSVANAEEYALLCEDGSRVPLNSSVPCSWLDRPWPAIMAQRFAAVGIQKLVASLKSNPDSKWQQAIQQLLDANRLELEPLSTSKIPEDYLRSVTGFLSANSIQHCDRSIKFCTYSELANAKCNWMSEAAKANGVKPNIICERHDNMEECMEEVSHHDSGALLIESDDLTVATRKYNLISVLHERMNLASNGYDIVAVVLANSSITNFNDLKGKRACFTQYESAGWNTAMYVLKSWNLLQSVCPYEKALGTFFSEMCIPHLNASHPTNKYLNNTCSDSKRFSKYVGDNGAIECIRSGKGDVAFVALNAISNGTDVKALDFSLKSKKFKILCPPNKTEECFLSRTNPGQIMVKTDTSQVNLWEIKLVFKSISNLFGRYIKQQKTMFQIFAPFDGHKNILFHDDTERLENTDVLMEYRPKNYEDVIIFTNECTSAAVKMFGCFSLIATTFAVILFCTLV